MDHWNRPLLLTPSTNTGQLVTPKLALNFCLHLPSTGITGMCGVTPNLGVGLLLETNSSHNTSCHFSLGMAGWLAAMKDYPIH